MRSSWLVLFHTPILSPSLVFLLVHFSLNFHSPSLGLLFFQDKMTNDVALITELMPRGSLESILEMVLFLFLPCSLFLSDVYF